MGSQKSKGIAMGSLLIKQESRLAHGRSFLTQNVAFTTARTLTPNAEQKTIQKEWKEKEDQMSLEREEHG